MASARRRSGSAVTCASEISELPSIRPTLAGSPSRIFSISRSAASGSRFAARTPSIIMSLWEIGPGRERTARRAVPRSYAASPRAAPITALALAGGSEAVLACCSAWRNHLPAPAGAIGRHDRAPLRRGGRRGGLRRGGEQESREWPREPVRREGTPPRGPPVALQRPPRLRTGRQRWITEN